MSTAFSSLTLSAAMLSNLESLGYAEMTPIQRESLPLVLEGRDVIARAKTGSGKTAAFGIGMIERLEVKRFRIQALVLCPTRELAEQVALELRRLARGIHNVKILTLCGGMPFGPQRASLEHGAHIVVGTPGRVQDHLGKGTLRFDDVRMLVLDEADRMLDMGFSESIMKIISNVPSARQTLLFSATYPPQIEAMSRDVLRDPVTVTVEAVHGGESIVQRFYRTTGDKFEALCALLASYCPESAVVFCNMKTTCDEVADVLRAAGWHALALHGDMEQRDRTEVLTLFANGSCPVLVATDVAARGLDIKALEAVVNFDLPHDPEVYVHRIGRTGRAGREGLALSLFTPRETKKLDVIERYTGVAVERAEPDALEPGEVPLPRRVTLMIDGGKKHKLRPGDILGALTGEGGIAGEAVGKIDVGEFVAYVAVTPETADAALKQLRDRNVKGRRFRVRRVG